MNFITEKEEVTQELGVWAVPSSSVPGRPFEYDIYHSVSYHWRDSAVFVGAVTVTVPVPTGVNLLAKAHETLDLKEVNALESYTQRMAGIAQERKGLALLGYSPTTTDEDYIDVVS